MCVATSTFYVSSTDPGHVEFLTKAKALGDTLIVGLYGDAVSLSADQESERRVLPNHGCE